MERVTQAAPDNHPLYNKLCDIYNDPASKALRDAGNWEKYYGDFAIGGIGPANGFFAGDWDKGFIGMTATQLKGFQLPTDDARRLQVAMIREQYKNALAKSSSGVDKATQDSYIANIKALFDDKKYQYSPAISSTEQTAFTTLPTMPGALLAAPEPLIGVGGGRRRRGRKSRRSRRSSRKNKQTRRR